MGSKKGKKSPVATKAANGAAGAGAVGADSALHGETLKMIQVRFASLVVLALFVFVWCWA